MDFPNGSQTKNHKVTAILHDINRFKAARRRARSHLQARLCTVTLKPRDGVLWAHPSPKAKSLTEMRPLDGLRINSQIRGSGGALLENIDLYAEPFPLAAT